nr:MAG TPA: hypothetical protein [Caudoviricetes sp.]DAR91704.1 MAG TPA: hypothetical protein [Caudoviricetes sp.]
MRCIRRTLSPLDYKTLAPQKCTKISRQPNFSAEKS